MKSNICTYIEFRGDLTYKVYPFNDVDMAIFSSLAYINFFDIKEHLPMTLNQAYEMIKQSDHYEIDKNIRIEDYNNIELLANTPRFKDIQLMMVSDIKDERSLIQFAAITLLLQDGTLVVSYRGTDDSIIGWHEDFNMYLDEPIGARNKAIEYLEDSANLKLPGIWYPFKKKAPIIITGHSKGGNLALYASLYTESLHQRICKVYNFDGPGLSKNDSNKTRYKEMMEKTVSYIPSYSFFGRLFHHGETIKVISSCNIGLEQHSISSWLVDKNGFIEDTLDLKGTEFTIKANDFVSNLGHDHTKEFIEALFSLLEFLGIKNMSDIKKVDILKYIDGFINIKSLSRKNKFDIMKFIQLMSEEMKRSKNMVDKY